MEIKQGPNKGYFYIPLQYVNDGSLVRTNQVYSRFSLGNGKRIQGFNSEYLPFIDGYYYIPKNTQIDTRKLAYALENKLMPSSGNTELFEQDFERIVVPDDYCPHYLKPCSYDWCKQCEIIKSLNMKGQNLTQNLNLTQKQIEKRNDLIWILSIFLSIVIVLALLS